MIFGARFSVWPLLLVLMGAPRAEAQTGQGDAAHFFGYYPKPGMRGAFDEGYRRHLEWHRARKDPLVWYGWYVTHGEREGMFIDATVGEPFGAFDRRVDPTGDAKDGAANVTAYADPALRAVYALRRELSTGWPLENRRPSAAVQVLRYRLRPGSEARFERAITAARAALLPQQGAPAHTWYRLVAGGRSPEYLLMIARDDWASYDRYHRTPAELIASTPAALDDYAASVQEVDSEIWSYHQDLSYLPGE